ncbi:hypothetical protein QDY65_08125 [Pyrococcus kukulkanii]
MKPTAPVALQSVADMAKEAQLLGAREVTIAYRRSLEHSYAKAEIKKLINKGVKFIEYVTPERVIGDERVREVEFAKTKIVGEVLLRPMTGLQFRRTT